MVSIVLLSGCQGVAIQLFLFRVVARGHQVFLSVLLCGCQGVAMQLFVF